MKRRRKNRKDCLRKWAAFISLLCIVSLAVSGCGQGGKDESSGKADQTEDAGKPGQPGEGADTGDTGQPGEGADTGDTGQPGENTKPGDTNQTGEDTKPEDSGRSEDPGADGGGTAGGSTDKEAAPKGDPDLSGEIKELNSQGFTAIENKTKEGENGGDVMVGPGQGADDSDFNKISVTYDESTTFSIRTIYDGGASYKDAKAGAEDLTEGISVEVWGKKSKDTLKAKTVRIIKVVF